VEELRTKVEELSTRNATLEGQTNQQATEIASLKTELGASNDRATTVERDLHVAQAEAQAANGRVDEIRLSTDKQLERLQASVDQARAAQSAAEERAVQAEKRAVAAEAHLEGERDAKGTLATGNDRMLGTLTQLQSELQGAIKRVEGEATRAAAAEATVAGLRDQLAQANSTQDLLRGMLERRGEQVPAAGADTNATRSGKATK
jgi:chromosome segregation ATPase